MSSFDLVMFSHEGNDTDSKILEQHVTDLPENLLQAIGTFLTLWERRRWWASSRLLWKELRPRLEANEHTLEWTAKHGGRKYFLDSNSCIITPRVLRHIFYPSLHQSLQHLNLSQNCDDGILFAAFSRQDLPGIFPNLKTLTLRDCPQITDYGIECIGKAESPSLEKLETLDITYCPNVSYACTLKLRGGKGLLYLPSLKIIRRQPEWLDGHFETPFDGAVQQEEGLHQPEVHTYFADGAFTFNRDFQSTGFVSQLRPILAKDELHHRKSDNVYEDVDENGDYVFLADKLQYNNFRSPEGWPPWTQFCYRPGVCLRKLPDNEQNPDDPNSHNHRLVLVGQHFRQLYPPTNRALMEKAKSLVPIGASRFFHPRTMEMLGNDGFRSGQREPPPFPEDANDLVMISKMRVRPLSQDQIMPPDDLCQACENTCTGMDSFGKDFLDFQEERLNFFLSGGAGDDQEGQPNDEEID